VRNRSAAARQLLVPLVVLTVGLAVSLAAAHFGVAGLTLQAIGEHAARWRALAALHPALAVAAFVLAYAGALVLFIPVALVLTFASGALFAPAVGAAASVAGACLGAAVSYALARYGLKARLGERGAGLPGRLLQRLEARVFLTTLAVRLAPLTPFTLFSLAAGRLRAAFSPFLAGTALGVLPECVVYALLGRRLAVLLLSGRAIRIGDMVQPGLLIPLSMVAALCLAGVFVSDRGAGRPGSRPV